MVVRSNNSRAHWASALTMATHNGTKKKVRLWAFTIQSACQCFISSNLLSIKSASSLVLIHPFSSLLYSTHPATLALNLATVFAFLLFEMCTVRLLSCLPWLCTCWCLFVLSLRALLSSFFLFLPRLSHRWSIPIVISLSPIDYRPLP